MSTYEYKWALLHSRNREITTIFCTLVHGTSPKAKHQHSNPSVLSAKFLSFTHSQLHTVNIDNIGISIDQLICKMQLTLPTNVTWK